MTPERRKAFVRRLTEQFRSTAASRGWSSDIDWIASDRDGHLAVFATAGLGAIPARVLRDPDGLVAVLEGVEKLRAVEFKPEGFIDDPASFVAFAFDYSGEGKVGMGQYVAGHGYERLRKLPTDPLSTESFGSQAANYLRDVRFAELCFGDSQEVVVEDAFAEIYRPTYWDRSSP
jgi:hypothetical protein